MTDHAPEVIVRVEHDTTVGAHQWEYDSPVLIFGPGDYLRRWVCAKYLCPAEAVVPDAVIRRLLDAAVTS